MLYNMTSPLLVEEGMKTLPGEGHKAFSCNLTDPQAATSLFSEIEREMGEVFACIHTAGQRPERKKLHLTTTEELRSQLENTTIASFNFLTNAARLLKGRGSGVLIGITTIGVVKAEATKSLGAYIPAKYAVQGMLTMLRDELAPYHVHVYSIAPGFMAGGMNKDVPQAFVEMVRVKSTSKTLASPTDIADVIASLCAKGISDYDDTLTITIAPEYL